MHGNGTMYVNIYLVDLKTKQREQASMFHNGGIQFKNQPRSHAHNEFIYPI